MKTASFLATKLDEKMLIANGVRIFPPATLDEDLPSKQGRDVYRELGGRLLLRYILPKQVGLFTNGSVERHFVCPTPYPPEDTVWMLALPKPEEIRRHIMILKPDCIDVICGPRWVDFGVGIEYILPEGFKKEALVKTWEFEIA